MSGLCRTKPTSKTRLLVGELRIVRVARVVCAGHTQVNRNFAQSFDVGHYIGFDRNIGGQTPWMTVMRRRSQTENACGTGNFTKTGALKLAEEICLTTKYVFDFHERRRWYYSSGLLVLMTRNHCRLNIPRNKRRYGSWRDSLKNKCRSSRQITNNSLKMRALSLTNPTDEKAQALFDDPLQMHYPDDAHSLGEQRFICFGFSE